MSYGTPTTCRFGALHRPSLLPAAVKPRPTETWAEMAAREGHRKGVPPSPGGTVAIPLRDRVLAALARRGPSLRKDIYASLQTCGDDLRPVLDALIAEGLAEEFTPPRVPGQPLRKRLALTPAGREKVQP